MGKVSKIIRVLTVAPIMALLMLVIVYISNTKLFGGPTNFVLSIVFLTILPLLAYPLQPFIKKFKDKGREGQRTLAMIFAVVGYVFGCLSALFLHAPKFVWIIYLTYLLSGALIMLFNKLFHLKASGHACGVTGPFAILISFGQILGYIGVPVLAAVYWASLHMKRHTLKQLLGGTVIPVAALAVVVIIIGCISQPSFLLQKHISYEMLFSFLATKF
jgi:hypothetical protein